MESHTQAMHFHVQTQVREVGHTSRIFARNVVAESVRVQASCAEGCEFEPWPSQIYELQT